jgi:hypothetical protein
MQDSKIIVIGYLDQRAFRYLYGDGWKDIDFTSIANNNELLNIDWQTDKPFILLKYDDSMSTFTREQTANLNEPMHIEFWYSEENLYVTKQDSSILIPKTDKELSHISIAGHGIEGFPENTLTVTINDESETSIATRPGEQYLLEIDFPTIPVGGTLKIKLHSDVAISPYDLGIGEDRRPLGVWIDQYMLL